MSKSLTTSEFIKNAINIHGYKYNYNLVNYINAHVKVNIICPIHGIFSIVPNKHVSRKMGCSKCGRIKQAESNKSNIIDFIQKANKIHNFKYNYSVSKYISSHDKLEILCTNHGLFKQTPSKHLYGDGCPKCGHNTISQKASNSPKGWNLTNWINTANTSKNFNSFKVYIIECWNEEERFYKIGRTFTKIEKRFKSFPYNFKVIKIFENTAKEIFELEQKLKNMNKENKYVPKINFNGMYECFIKLENYEVIFT